MTGILHTLGDRTVMILIDGLPISVPLADQVAIIRNGSIVRASDLTRGDEVTLFGNPVQRITANSG